MPNPHDSCHRITSFQFSFLRLGSKPSLTRPTAIRTTGSGASTHRWPASFPADQGRDEKRGRCPKRDTLRGKSMSGAVTTQRIYRQAMHKRVAYFRTRIRITVRLFKYGRHKKMWQRSMQRIKLFQAKDEVLLQQGIRMS